MLFFCFFVIQDNLQATVQINYDNKNKKFFLLLFINLYKTRKISTYEQSIKANITKKRKKIETTHSDSDAFQYHCEISLFIYTHT